MSDLVIAFIPGPRNAANLGTKILGVPQFKSESTWYMRGIHSLLYQESITGTLKDLWMRMFVWDRDLQRRREEGECVSDVDANSTNITSKEAEEKA